MSEEEIALAWLKARIEDMSDQCPMWSKTAWTHRRTLHRAFANGALRVEGEEITPMGDYRERTVRDMADATLAAVRDYRATIEGPVLLTWRCEPTIRGDGAGRNIYCRLALEPDLLA